MKQNKKKRFFMQVIMKNKKQLVKQKYTSNFMAISTGVPQVCVLAPPLFFLSIDYISLHYTAKLLKFALNMSVVCLVQKSDIGRIWSSQLFVAVIVKIVLNIKETVEMVVHFWKPFITNLPLNIMKGIAPLESYRLLGTTPTKI